MMTDGAGQSETDRSAARAEAVLALREALTWHLSASRWAQVHGAVAEVAAAASAGPDALRQAIVLLELCGPLRVAARLGDAPQLPAPMPVRERIAELVDALTDDGPPDADDASDQDLTARM